MNAAGSVDLYWLPLGAGGHSVRYNGKIFEAVAARLAHRSRQDLYHAALEVSVSEARFIIEQAPAARPSDDHGVVATGPVGTRFAGRFRLFRYEIRRWPGGVIPDVDQAVESPRRLTADVTVAQRVLEFLPEVPTPVWGRDELGTGEMWNSNSVVAWVLARAGVDLAGVRLPSGGRAPGWQAGLAIAARQSIPTTSITGVPAAAAQLGESQVAR